MDDIVRQAIAKWPNVPHCYGWLGLVAWLSLVPRPPGAGLIPTDVGHFIAYAWLTGWYAQLRADFAGRRLAALWVCGYGALIEGLQGFTQARDPSLLDIAINAAGALAGLMAMRTPLGRVLDAVIRRADGAAVRRAS